MNNFYFLKKKVSFNVVRTIDGRFNDINFRKEPGIGKTKYITKIMETYNKEKLDGIGLPAL